MLNYIGTIPEQGTGTNGSCNSNGGNFTNPNPATWMVCLNPLSRYQVTDVLADQTFATIKFDTGPVRNTVVTGTEILARDGQHRHLQRPEFGGRRRRRLCQRLRRPGLGLEPAQLPDLRHASTDRRSGHHSGRYQKRLRAGNGELPGFRHPDGGSALRPVQYQRQQGRVSDRVGRVRHVELQSRPRRQADADRQCLCGLWHVIRTGGRRTRRHVGQLRRTQSDVADQPDFQSGREPRQRKSAPSGSCSTGICWRPRRCSAPTSAMPAS